MKISELKSEALKNLQGKWMVSIAVCIVVYLFTRSYNFYVATGEILRDIDPRIMLRIPSAVKSCSIELGIEIIIAPPFTLGISTYFLNLIRDKDEQFEDIFHGFKIYWKTILLEILRSIFVLMWSLLLIVPGIIAAISYSMSYYIMSDDPDCNPMDAIDLSKSMMNGNKMRYFLLVLSFIGWALLEVVTFGIAAIWVEPYGEAAFANFYEDVKNDFEKI